jgi:hypothetical protein
MFATGKKRKYCNLQCSAEGIKKRRIELAILPRYSERIMWLRYWYYRNKGFKIEAITDLNHANDFQHCQRELNETVYKNNKIKNEYNQITS